MEQYLYFIFFSNREEACIKINIDYQIPPQNIASTWLLIKKFVEIFNGKLNQVSEGISIDINDQPIQNNEQLKIKINKFVQCHKSNMPEINKMNDYFKKLSEDEYFFVIPTQSDSIPTIDKIRLIKELRAINKQCSNLEDLNKENKVIDELFGVVLEKYDAFCKRNDIKNKIGEGLKSNRVCRFCMKNDKETSFKKVAHAISEALGNKNIILNEECDCCNEYFSRTLEKDILVYLRFFNTFYQIKNKKNHVPKIRQSKFGMTHINPDDPKNKEIIEQAKNIPNTSLNLENFFVINYKSDINSQTTSLNSDKIPSLPLEFDDEITMQNIYKALVKFALSCVDSLYLDNFKETLHWLRNGNLFEEKLPNIGVLTNPKKLEESPYMVIYIRKDDDSELPFAIGEFHYTIFTYVFIIPSNQDKIDFTQNNNFDKFKHFFRFYQFEQLPWSFGNFSCSTPKKFIFKMDFMQREK